MAEKAQDKKQKNPQGKGSEEYRGQKPGEKAPQQDQKKGNDKKKW